MLIVALSFPSWKGSAQPQQTAASPTAQISLSPKLDAKVIGTVLDPNGVPLEGCMVYAFTDGSSPPRDVTVTTDFNGNFAIDVYSGHVLLFAYKESDLYHNNIFGFDVPAGTDTQSVEVRSGETVRGFVLHLPRQSALLRLDVSNEDTKEPVNPVEYELCREDHAADPTYCVKGNADPGFPIVVPPDPISINLTAPNYMEWRYLDAKTGSSYLTLKPTENRTLVVYLHPTIFNIGSSVNTAQSQQESNPAPPPYPQSDLSAIVGSVQGVVLDEGGNPVSGATVYAEDMRRPIFASSDATGTYTLPDVPVGVAYVFAFKESDGYPNEFWAFYTTNNDHSMLKIEVKPGQVTTGANFHLGPKAAYLKVDATDEKGLPVEVSYKLERDDQPMPLNTSVPTDPRIVGGGFINGVMLVPPVLFRLTVLADGYEPWHYGGANWQGRVGLITLKSGKTLKLSVRLRHFQ